MIKYYEEWADEDMSRYTDTRNSVSIPNAFKMYKKYHVEIFLTSSPGLFTKESCYWMLEDALLSDNIELLYNEYHDEKLIFPFDKREEFKLYIDKFFSKVDLLASFI